MRRLYTKEDGVWYNIVMTKRTMGDDETAMQNTKISLMSVALISFAIVCVVTWHKLDVIISLLK